MTKNKCIYIVISILIIVFFIKEIDFFNDNFYKNINYVKNPNDLLVLVNKNNKLEKTYIPNDLELLSLEFSNSNKYLRKEAKLAFEELSRNAKKEGMTIIAVSTYRDYDYQEKLYNSYVNGKGEEYADKCSARAGHSEHQTGLAVDVMGSNNDYDEFESSKEFKWMINNAHKYGFILRYPKGSWHITGFKYEPWHYRYVGINVAKYIYDNNITLEEYKKSH